MVLNLIRDLNIIEAENYARLIKKAKPIFIEVKEYMPVGFARKRLGYDKMLFHKNIVEFSKKMLRIKQIKRWL